MRIPAFKAFLSDNPDRSARANQVAEILSEIASSTITVWDPMWDRRRLVWKLFHYFKVLHERNGGRGGIRTHETLSRLLVFKTSAFNHSATRPRILAVPGLRLSNCLCGARPH